MKNYSEQQIIDAIEDSGGMIQSIAQKLGCAWHTAEKYVNMFESTKQALADECESVLDLAESKLIENIEDNDNTAIIFLLKTKGKKRGYVERYENVNENTNTNLELTPEEREQRIKELQSKLNAK